MHRRRVISQTGTAVSLVKALLKEFLYLPVKFVLARYAHTIGVLLLIDETTYHVPNC